MKKRNENRDCVTPIVKLDTKTLCSPSNTNPTIYCMLQSSQSHFNCAVTLYCKQFVSAQADTVTLGHLLLLTFIMRKKEEKKSFVRPTAKQTGSPYCAKCVFHVCSSPPFHDNCIPEPNTHPLVIWHRLFDAPCESVYAHTCVFVLLEHITVGKPNLPAIVLIKVLFLQLTLNGRQHQLHKTTGKRRGCLPQPRWHLLWTSPDFKRYSQGDYRVTDRVKKKREKRKICPSYQQYPNGHIMMPLKHAWKPADTAQQ